MVKKFGLEEMNEDWVKCGIMRNPEGKYLRDFCEVGYVKEGVLTLHADGKSCTVGKGRAFLLKAEEEYRIKTICSATVLSLQISRKAADRIFADRELISPLLKETSGDAAALIGKMARELQEKRYGYLTVMSGEINNFLIQVCRKEQTRACYSPSDDETSDYLGKLLKEMHRNYAEITFDDAARLMRLSRAYFSVVFHKYTGSTFSRYLNNIRIKAAVEMIKKDSSASVTEVSLSCGFNTIRNFNRTFKEITGYTPSKLPADFVFPSPSAKEAEETISSTAVVYRFGTIAEM